MGSRMIDTFDDESRPTHPQPGLPFQTSTNTLIKGHPVSRWNSSEMAGSGAGSRLPTWLLLLAGISTIIAVLVSMMSIFLQLRNYRKPALQRMVVRIMLMVPLYAISSLISLFSVEAAFVIDAIRDIYEAFVIYCFFVLLLSYLGGERSLLILLHGRPPKEPVFPINLIKHEIDVSDPHTFLFLKRGILQYVQVKPVLAAATLILKALGKYNEGDFRANSGYLYVSIVYNISICTSLYCLAMFWVCVNDDLKPFRPVPKFLCVKGILFFSFWQSIGISTLVAARVITRLGPYTDPENVSVGLNDLLICMEMPFFAFAHMYAFSYKDFVDPTHTFVARMPMYYAFRDSFGLLDVVEDTKTTLRGEGMDYREFEPAEGFMHQGVGRDRRIRAGLRYSKGGQRKYWLPKATEDTQPPGRLARTVNKAIKKIAGEDQAESVTAPLLPSDAQDVVHLAPDLQRQDSAEDNLWVESSSSPSELENGYELPFGDPDEGDEELYAHSRRYLFGDYNYPCIDVSSESARTFIWAEEERVLRDERGAWFSPIRGAQGQAAMQSRSRPAWEGYGAVDNAIVHPRSHNGSRTNKSKRDSALGLPPDHFYKDGDEHLSPPRSQDQRLVDHDVEARRAAEPKDVLMRWTKTQNRPGPSSTSHSHQSQSHSHSQSPVWHTNSMRQAPTASSSSSLASGSGNGNSPASHRVWSPASLSRENSRRKGSPNLPPDAVDLVVEDKDAAEEDLMRERRKGEPSTRGGSGLRKVYRRGERLEGEVEISDGDPSSSGSRRVEVGGEIIHAIGDEENDDRKEDAVYGSSEWVQETEGVVARTGTPPLHARVQAPHYYHDIPDDDNPWA